MLGLKNDREKLKAMSRASRECAPDKALDIIYGEVYENYLADMSKKKDLK